MREYGGMDEKELGMACAQYALNVTSRIIRVPIMPAQDPVQMTGILMGITYEPGSADLEKHLIETLGIDKGLQKVISSIEIFRRVLGPATAGDGTQIDYLLHAHNNRLLIGNKKDYDHTRLLVHSMGLESGHFFPCPVLFPEDGCLSRSDMPSKQSLDYFQRSLHFS